MLTRVSSLQNRLFWAFAVVILIAASVPLLFLRGNLYEERLNLAKQEALSQAIFLRGLLDPLPSENELQRLFGSAVGLPCRITLMDASGKVVRDSHISAEDMPELDNHGDRPEIEEALASGNGVSLRYSNSLGIDAVYAAVALQNGGTLRIAVPLAEIKSGLEAGLSSLTLIVMLVAVFCLLLSALVTRQARKGLEAMTQMVASIAHNKGGHHLLEAPYKEFIPLAKSVNQMSDSIENHLRTMVAQQRQLEIILNSMSEGVLVLGPQGNIRRWNRAMADMFPAVQAAKGRPLIDAIPVPALQQRVDTLLGGPGAATLKEEENSSIHFKLPGRRYMVAGLSSPMEANDTLGAVIVIYDATELMRLERVRKDFVANVSHELRTPLTAIAGYAETLMDSPDLSEEYRNFARIISKNANMLAKVINDLFALARVENNAEPLVLATVNPALPLEEALTLCREQAEAKKLTIETELDGTAVRSSAMQLAQVFRNLLENAIRYSPKNGKISISGKLEGANVLFAVSDNGPGIPDNEQTRIFERFYQVEKERNSGTSGIGLALCKHVIERQGGRIWVESPHGEAATAMRFTLPAIIKD